MFLEGVMPQHDLVIRTPRLRLRAVNGHDLQIEYEMMRSTAVMEFLPRKGELTEEETKAKSEAGIRTMSQEGLFSFAVELCENKDESGPTIGFVGIFRVPQISYLLHDKYWGKGYATEALGAFLSEYWSRYPEGLPSMPEEFRHALRGHVQLRNFGSQKVMKNCGFIYLEDGIGINDVQIQKYEIRRPN
ncbi:acyl-CoA N-acyltransferase [Thozetella sp. PMI_491]|nr:acyl-CoA N-acyltransferase [Thozetella sp. PMI_491]